MTEQLSAQEYADTIEKLDKKGIHYDKTKSDDIHFKCDVHPYLPEPLPDTIQLFHKIGNMWTFYGPTKTLVIKNTNFSLDKK